MNRNQSDEQRGESRIPENNPSKAMDSKREVEQSNDEKTDQDFPGYPHYPAREDIMDQRTDSHRVDADVEKLPSSNNTGLSQRFLAGQDRDKAEQAMIPGPATDDQLDFDQNRGDSFPTTQIANEEIGTPQNVSNEDLSSGSGLPGTDLDEAGSEREKGA